MSGHLPTIARPLPSMWPMMGKTPERLGQPKTGHGEALQQTGVIAPDDG